MILGVGLDIVDVDAFALQLADPASAFVDATFRPGERRGSSSARPPGGGPLRPGPGPGEVGPVDGGTDSRPDGRRDGARHRTAQHLAGRFAAKEALVKAWSVARRGRPPALAQVDLRDIEVVDDGYGRPALRLHGAVRDAVGDLSSGAPVIAHLSISHDGPTAAAVVILEAASPPAGSPPGVSS